MVRAYEAIVFVALVLHPEDFCVVLWGRLRQWEGKLICVTNYPCCRKQMWPLSGLELRFDLRQRDEHWFRHHEAGYSIATAVMDFFQHLQ